MLLFHTRNLLALCLVSVIALSTRAQDSFDIFGGNTPPANADNGSIFGGPATPPAGGNPGSTNDQRTETNPLVLSVRDNPPKSPEEMARAVGWMAGIKRMDEVSRLFTAIQAANWGTAQKAAMSRSVGLAKLLKLQSSASELSDEHQLLLREIVAAPKKIAESPAWIDKWIKELASDDVGSQRLAFLRLQDSGDKAIVALLADLQSSSPQVDPNIAVRTIAAFGPQGVSALRAACLVGDQQSAGRTTLAVASMDALLFQAEVIAAIHGDTVDEAARQTILKLPLPAGTSNQTAATDWLTEHYQASEEAYQVARQRTTETVASNYWILSGDGNSVIASKLSMAGRTLAETAHAARLLLSLNAELDAKLRHECLAVLLQNAGNAAAVNLEDFEIANLMAACDRLQLHTAALAVMKAITSGDLSLPLANLELLSRYLDDPRPQFRYEALAAIVQADPHFSYAGAERALHVAFEMSQLRGGPSVLVIGHHSELTQAAKQQVEMVLEGKAYTANSAKSAFRILTTDAPIEHILIVDRVPDQSIFMLLQRLRGGRASHDLPIAVLTDELTENEMRLLGKLPGIVYSVLSRNDSQIRRIADQLVQEIDTPPMGDGERLRYSDIGTSFLTKVIADRPRYAFYPVGDLREKLQSLDIALSAQARAELLVGLGTSDSQLRLIRMAADGSLGQQDRMQAAEKFKSSANRFGIMLDPASQRRIYDLYNQLGPSDPITAQSLGVILDSLEQR